VISADAGVWLAFFQKEAELEGLQALLEQERVTVHPYVLLELQLRLRGMNRAKILGDLGRLVSCHVAGANAVALFIDEQELAGLNLDFVGVHLLVSAVQSGDQVWSSDEKVRACAERLKLLWEPNRETDAATAGARRRR
jgi:hypothetical protein